MSEELVNLEIDGKPIKARKGAMLISVADDEGIVIPRFCYHHKLQVAANCRMCLVEVEKAPKPMPACATPISEGMKVYTRSRRALSAQRATMEFLLINHPLDCPICDQGGECELQDLAMGYGRDISRYTESKRVVKDENLGPLISTDMTRCIHCTRCVRFGTEIAGIQELGATGRGEFMRIGTYVARTVDHELSGNVIDLCPVGALNSKPFKMHGRGWEMTEIAAVSPHDCVGSNLYGHVLRGECLRVVPRANEAVNECWITDRDRFSYDGIRSLDRLLAPMVKRNGQWEESDWETALETAASLLQESVEKYGAEQLGIIASAGATVEELYLLGRVAAGFGTGNIDTRIRQADFADQQADPAYPGLGQSLEALESLDAALVIGSNIRKDVPLIGHRLRKAALAGGRMMFINPVDFEFLFPVAHRIITGPQATAGEVAAVLKAVIEASGKEAPAHLRNALKAAKPGEVHAAIGASLLAAEKATVLLGQHAFSNPAYSDIRALAAAVCHLAGAKLAYVPEGANSAGAWLAGALPHRGAGGVPRESAGLDARAMFDQPRKAYLLMGVEPEQDCWDGAQAQTALQSAGAVVAISPFATDAMKAYADVLLPAGTFTETSGTYVNVEGRWQSFTGMVSPLGEARPAWKILRVIGNLLDLPGFEYSSTEEIRDELRAALGDIGPDNEYRGTYQARIGKAAKGLQRIGGIALYGSDPLVRRSRPLQNTADAGNDRLLQLSPADAKALGLTSGNRASVAMDSRRIEMEVLVNPRIADGTARVVGGIPLTAGLGPLSGTLAVGKTEGGTG